MLCLESISSANDDCRRLYAPVFGWLFREEDDETDLGGGMLEVLENAGVFGWLFREEDDETGFDSGVLEVLGNAGVFGWLFREEEDETDLSGVELDALENAPVKSKRPSEFVTEN